MAPKTKGLLILFAGLALFVLLLIFGTNALLKLVPSGAPPPSVPLAPVEDEQNDIDIRLREGEEGTVYRIQPGGEDRRPITYTASGFQPNAVTIRSTDDIGCLITIVNRSAAPLRVGVGPHAATGDPGADYGLLQPGETGVMDVRYPGLGEIVLHNHMNSAHEFPVSYGEGCR